MRFDTDSSGQRRRHSVQDYSSRKVQMRLAVLVFCVMTVLILMIKVGQPETWEWMGFHNDDSQKPKVPFDSKEIDTRIIIEPDKSTRQTDVIRIDLQETNTRSQPKGTERIDAKADNLNPDDSSEVQLPEQAKSTEGNDDFEIAQRDFWEKTYAKLSVQDKTILFHVLRAAKYNDALNPASFPDWPLLLEDLDVRRKSYYTSIMQRVQSLPEDQLNEKQRWLNTLSKLQQSWDEDLRGALDRFLQQSTSPTEQPVFTAEQLAAIDQLLSLLDKIALDYVEDNAMTSKRSDMQAWYGLFDRLQRLSADELQAASVGPVSYVQLFEQPDFYRGKMVTIYGEVRGAYWVPAGKNPMGIERYYVFWVRPVDGSNNPIAVYALEPPAGFPEIHQQNENSDKETWKEPVEVNGCFLKKLVYLSQDSARVCPLLLAKSLDWKPVEPQPAAQLPGIPAVLATILAVGFAAIVIAYFAFRVSSRRLIKSKKNETESVDFDPDKIVRNISD